MENTYDLTDLENAIVGPLTYSTGLSAEENNSLAREIAAQVIAFLKGESMVDNRR